MDRLAEGVQFVKGVGPQRSKLLHKLEIETVFDLLWYVPRNYFNRAKVIEIAALSDGMIASIRGKVVTVKQNRTRRGFHLLKAGIEDNTGLITAVWFNQPYLGKNLKTGEEVLLKGKVKAGFGSVEFNVSEYDLIEGDEVNVPVVPIYTLTEGLNQKNLRKIILYTLDNYLPYYYDILDSSTRQSFDLCDIQTAFRNIHFPGSGEAFLAARRRLAFEELLLFRLSLLRQNDSQGINRAGTALKPRNNLVDRIIDSLSFKLTRAQQTAFNEIIRDMESPYSMNRLLQGDVGSGKTVVAALAMAHAVASGSQAAIMVPTEILAEQHYATLNRYFAGTDTVVACLTGGTNPGERRTILEAAASGEIDILVGTHALIQSGLQFNNLGLAVIDEQHRFGVRQRARLGNKGAIPDVLVMTATPIPRTLALALYGDLNVSVIDELPPGRREVKTAYIPREARPKAYRFVHAEIEKGAQAYVVCPLIEESENLDLQAAVSLHAELSAEIYPDLAVNLLHGRMKPAEKEQVMLQFKKGEIDVLVTTTVVEVGVDISNACIMVIEHAERFGLSQLHQLRGRVGRGTRQSYCILVGEPKTEEALRRLQAMEKTSNGFELANEDLMIRGPGDFLGVKQHGLNELKVANLRRDGKIIADSSQAAAALSSEHVKDEIIKFYLAHKFKKSAEIAMN
jgi:ATP-dependent DNA helicase RecG